MLFFPIAALLSPLLFTSSALAALTPDQVVTNIGIVTSVSGNLNSILGGLTTSSDVRTIAKQTQADFQTIINDLGGDVTAMQATPPFPDSVTQPIVDALTDFVKVHQDLLSTVIGKHGIFAQFGVTAPIAAVLRSLEGAIDSFAFAMIALIPTQTPSVQGDKSSLDQSVKNAVATYEELCIPIIPGGLCIS